MLPSLAANHLIGREKGYALPNSFGSIGLPAPHLPADQASANLKWLCLLRGEGTAI